MCLFPRFYKNPKYKPNKKNGGVAPAVHDVRVIHVPVGCQQCMECKKQKARDWQARLFEEIKEKKNGHFITLTLSDQSYKTLNEEINSEISGYERDNAIITLATRRFLERWRKKYKRSLRHWFVTELGHNGTENIHIHGIVWTNSEINSLKDIWQYGYTWSGDEVKGKRINYVDESTVTYIVKYISKTDYKHKYYKARILTSSGIGSNYTLTAASRTNKYTGKTTREYYRTGTGHKISLPIYYRNKIYTDKQREQLWINKLDKEERYVLGVKIDVSQSDKDYTLSVNEARKINESLGFGSDKINWKEKAYEEDMRAIAQLTRIKRAKLKETEIIQSEKQEEIEDSYNADYKAQTRAIEAKLKERNS